MLLKLHVFRLVLQDIRCSPTIVFVNQCPISAAIMLSPFKSFLNNASAKLFGLASSDDSVSSTTMAATNEEVTVLADERVSGSTAAEGSTDETADTIQHAGDNPPQTLAYTDQESFLVMFPPSDDGLSQQHCDDPLSDPLAVPYDQNPLELINPKLTTEIEANADILLVDVDRLNNSSPVGEQREDENPFVESTAQPCANEVEEGVRSDGSDSGLGSEPSNNVLIVPVKTAVSPLKPLRTNLKRRSDTLILDGVPQPDEIAVSPKRPKRNITFTDVNVYYFQRMQGFMCVPSQGGCTLGMAASHMHHTRFSTLAEYAAEQRRCARQKLQEQKRLIGLAVSSSDDSDSDEEASDHTGSDSETDSNSFLQPVSPRQRRVMLKAAGVRKIDALEKDECKYIRASREECGCKCRGFCDPETCACAQMGIKCQVDRANYPCGCTLDCCGNTVGRVAFNPTRVRTHFIHTILRLEMESKQQEPIVHSHTIDSPSSSRFTMTANNNSVLGNELTGAPSSLGWHSNMGQSLAASSATHNLHAGEVYTQSSAIDPYNNGLMSAESRHLSATDLIDANNPRIESGFIELTGHQMSHFNQQSLHQSNSPTNSVARPILSPTLDLHFVYRDNLNSNPYDAGPFAMSSCAASFESPSAQINTAYMPSIYSPDSAAIVETPSTSTGTTAYGKSPSCSSYSEFGNVTGYQHSYLYSLQQHSHVVMPTKTDEIDLDDEIFGACINKDNGLLAVDGKSKSSSLQTLSEFLDPCGSQTSTEEYLDFSSDNPKDFESDLEPIDFESEIGLSASIIDKSLIKSMSATKEEFLTDDEEVDETQNKLEAVQVTTLLDNDKFQLNTVTDTVNNSSQSCPMVQVESQSSSC